MSSIVLPNNFGYIAAPLVSIGWLVFGQSILVVRARVHANIAYPQLYAEKAECKENQHAHVFNCTQQYLPMVVIGTVVAGFKCPIVAAALGSGFVFGRILYTIGYRTGKPENRLPGSHIANLSVIGLLLSATYSAFKLFPSA